MEKQILEKIERNAEMRGMTVVSNDGVTLIIDDSDESTNIRVSYEQSHTVGSSPMVGIDDSSNPFLGVGVQIPGTIRIAIGADDDDENDEVIADLQGDISVDVLKVLRICNHFANDVKLVKENGGAGDEFAIVTRGDEKLAGLGQ